MLDATLEPSSIREYTAAIAGVRGNGLLDRSELAGIITIGLGDTLNLDFVICRSVIGE
jgi:hypothetical protein